MWMLNFYPWFKFKYIWLMSVKEVPGEMGVYQIYVSSFAHVARHMAGLG